MPTDSENKEASTSTTDLLTSANSIKTARVFRIGDDGNESFIGEKDAEWSYNASLDKQEKMSLRFYCPACDDDTGDYCKALLFPRRTKSGNGENRHYSYSFSTRPKQIHNHEIESRKYNISPIVRYNCYSFLNRILKSKKNKEKKDNSVEVLPTFDLPVKGLPQIQPKTVVDYYIQTRTCDPDELMPKSEFTFGECLVNSYSIQEFRSGEKDFGRPILVIAGKTNPAISSALFEENAVVLSNRIRARAGLAPYSGYTLERLQKERRYELMFEGMRFNDLRRWYPEKAGEIIEKNQTGGYIEFLGKANTYKELPGRSFSQRYALTRGFWMIPQEQINLQQGLLEQNEGFKDGQSYLFVDGDLPY